MYTTIKRPLIITSVFLTLFFGYEGHAEPNTIRLICKYSHTIHANGSTNRTSGEDLVTVNYTDNGDATIKKQGLGAEFIGKISDEEIYGETAYKMFELTYHQTLRINRYTGAFEITFKIIGSEDGLIHCGTCEQISEKKF